MEIEKQELTVEELNEVAGGMITLGPTKPTFPIGTKPTIPIDPLVGIHI